MRITDFGLAKHTNQEGLKTFCGTPQYFAPEVLKRKGTESAMGVEGGRYGKAADMWSLGVIVYILLSGTFPFDEDALYDQIKHAQYSFSGAEWKHISVAAMQFIKSLMTLRADDRLTIEKALVHPWMLGIDMPPLSNVNVFQHLGNNQPNSKSASRKTTGRPHTTKNIHKLASQVGSSTSTSAATSSTLWSKPSVTSMFGISRKASAVKKIERIVSQQLDITVSKQALPSVLSAVGDEVCHNNNTPTSSADVALKSDAVSNVVAASNAGSSASSSAIPDPSVTTESETAVKSASSGDVVSTPSGRKRHLNPASSCKLPVTSEFPHDVEPYELPYDVISEFENEEDRNRKKQAVGGKKARGKLSKSSTMANVETDAHPRKLRGSMRTLTDIFRPKKG